MDTYIVKKNDTLISIANELNIPSSVIINANNLEEPFILKEGDILNIPTEQADIFDFYTISKDDTLYSIAKKFDTTVDMIVAINGLNKDEYIYPNQTLLVPKKGILTYITKEGDTINFVSSVFDAYPMDILYNNNNIFLLPDQLIVYRKS